MQRTFLLVLPAVTGRENRQEAPVCTPSPLPAAVEGKGHLCPISNLSRGGGSCISGLDSHGQTGARAGAGALAWKQEDQESLLVSVRNGGSQCPLV